MNVHTPVRKAELAGPKVNPDWAKLPLFDRSNWQRVKFGDVVENVNDTERNPAEAEIERFIGLEHLAPGSLHISSWGNVADGTTFNRRCRPGQVLFGKRRAYQRKVALAGFDAVVSGDILADKEPEKRGREIEIKLVARLRRHLGNPKFTALGERLEKIKERHEQSFLTSLEFLKQILELAKDVVKAEKEADPQEERDKAKEALTELFTEAKSSNTHIIFERIVAEIDDIVKKVRFPDWQRTT